MVMQHPLSWSHMSPQGDEANYVTEESKEGAPHFIRKKKKAAFFFYLFWKTKQKRFRASDGAL